MLISIIHLLLIRFITDRQINDPDYLCYCNQYNAIIDTRNSKCPHHSEEICLLIF